MYTEQYRAGEAAERAGPRGVLAAAEERSVLPRLTRLTPPWQRRQQAEWREYAALINRFEQRLLAALDAYDERPAMRRAATRAAFAVQQADHALTRAAAAQYRADRLRERTMALAAVARAVRQDVRRRLLFTAIAVPATFAGWLVLAWVLTGR
jgi:hypothetical protein